MFYTCGISHKFETLVAPTTKGSTLSSTRNTGETEGLVLPVKDLSREWKINTNSVVDEVPPLCSVEVRILFVRTLDPTRTFPFFDGEPVVNLRSVESKGDG